MLPFKIVYHPRYDLNLGPHVFPSQKFRLIQEQLVRDDIAERDDFVEPEPACDEDLLRVHTPEWVGKLKNGTLSASDIMKLEVPYSPELAEAVWLAAGGSILAGQLALRDGFASNLTGGFHHAHANHGEGFCAIHDVAVAIRRLQADGAIKKAIVVDTDVHHGNGTAHIFRNDDSVFTLSIHQENNYPAHKPPSNVDLSLDDGVEDEEYLSTLLPAVERALDRFRPDVLFYVGGADPFEEDQLGGLRLSKAGLKARDKGVFSRRARSGYSRRDNAGRGLRPPGRRHGADSCQHYRRGAGSGRRISRCSPGSFMIGKDEPVNRNSQNAANQEAGCTRIPPETV